MGDIADMMLEGMLCQGCGEFLGDGDGYPVFCKSCGGAEESTERHHRKAKREGALLRDAPKVWGCTGCRKMFRKKTYAQEHCSATKHGEPIDTTRKQ